ncbi:family 16 glycosylhydrolase [Streptomyces sp. 8K308]|uniref:family 16 glycosylhydrolase n=1 Tax=Streptomyces sp. 8K308 TaxID=2530388 RepID=UPI0032665D10
MRPCSPPTSPPAAHRRPAARPGRRAPPVPGGRCAYTSARLNTAGRFTARYGHVEARMRTPRGQGMWPAFRMLGNDIGQIGWPASGEIDVLENVGFRTFAVDWSPGRISWSVDGQVHQTRTPADLGGDPWVSDKPFFLMSNLAVGGYWPGNPDSTTVFPQRLVVDHVRVSTSDAGARTGPIAGLGGQCVDVAGANTANGTPSSCTTATAPPRSPGRWAPTARRALGKCLDVVDGGTGDGIRVQLWTCAGTANQKWTAP